MSTTGGEENHGWWRASADASESLPELRFADWRETKDTLHLYLQILGKVRMQLAPPRNHWWHVTLYTDTRGLTTRRLHHRDTTFDIRLDLVEHALVVSTDDGRTEGFPLLDGLSVARFDDELHRTLRELGLDVDITERPFGLPIKTPFADDVDHRAWDGDAVERFWRILDWSGGGVRGVQRLVLRQDEPGAPVLALARPRRHEVLGAPRARGARRPHRARGLLTRGDLLRVLARRRQPGLLRVLLVHRARARWAAG